MDSAHPEIRQIEKPYFKKMIQHQEEIAAGVYETKQQLEQAGFPIMMDTEINSGHLFYEYQNERLLLERTPERSEEHTSELQSRFDLVCILLLEKKKNRTYYNLCT